MSFLHIKIWKKKFENRNSSLRDFFWFFSRTIFFMLKFLLKILSQFQNFTSPPPPEQTPVILLFFYLNNFPPPTGPTYKESTK